MPEKLQTLDDDEERGIQSQSTRTAQQIENRLRTDCNESETTEAIEKMVLGLRNLQIGDSTSVPYHLSKLEKQVTINSIWLLVKRAKKKKKKNLQNKEKKGENICFPSHFS